MGQSHVVFAAVCRPSTASVVRSPACCSSILIRYTPALLPPTTCQTTTAASHPLYCWLTAYANTCEFLPDCVRKSYAGLLGLPVSAPQRHARDVCMLAAPLVESASSHPSANCNDRSGIWYNDHAHAATHPCLSV